MFIETVCVFCLVLAFKMKPSLQYLASVLDFQSLVTNGKLMCELLV